MAFTAEPQSRQPTGHRSRASTLNPRSARSAVLRPPSHWPCAGSAVRRQTRRCPCSPCHRLRLRCRPQSHCRLRAGPKHAAGSAQAPVAPPLHCETKRHAVRASLRVAVVLPSWPAPCTRRPDRCRSVTSVPALTPALASTAQTRRRAVQVLCPSAILGEFADALRFLQALAASASAPPRPLAGSGTNRS